MPKVSIIIPVYNVEKYLDKCIESAIRQTLQDIEIILVDDGSPDNCPKLCDEYAKADSCIKVIHKKNEGLGFARNSGLEIATGEYVTFLDSDDFVDLEAYEELYNIAKENSLDIIRFECNRFINENNYRIGSRYKDKVEIHTGTDILREIALNIFAPSVYSPKESLRFNGSSCFALFRREIITNNKIVFPSEREILGEDYIFCFKFMLFANRFGFIDRTYYHYRINPDSLTQKAKLDKITKAVYNCKYIIALLREYNFPESANTYPILYFINTVRVLTYQIMCSGLSLKDKKAWLKKQSEITYISYVSDVFPMNKLPYFYQAFHKAIASNSFYSTLLLSMMIRLKKNIYRLRLKYKI